MLKKSIRHLPSDLIFFPGMTAMAVVKRFPGIGMEKLL